MKLLYIGTEPLAGALADALSRSRGAHEVTTATNKDQFLTQRQPGAVDILLFDYCAPAKDLPLSQVLIYARAFKMPVVVLGSVSQDLPVDDLHSAGISGYLFREHLSQLPFVLGSMAETNQLEQEAQELYQALERTGQHYQTLLKCMHEFVFLFNEQGELMYLSPSAHQLAGISDVDGHPLFELIHEDDRRQFFFLFKKVLKKPDTRVDVLMRIRHKSGHYIWIEGGVTNLIKDPAIEAFVLSCRDVTDRTNMEKELLSINRLYASIRQFQRNILEATEERKLFKELCHTATEFGNFKIAFIHLLDPTNGRLRLNQSSGVAEPDVEPSMVLGNLENGPFETVLRTGECLICNDVQGELSAEYWKYVAQQKRFQSFIILPLSRHGQIIGVFVLASAEVGAFHAKAAQLLTEASDDISMKLDHLRKAALQNLQPQRMNQPQNWA